MLHAAVDQRVESTFFQYLDWVVTVHVKNIHLNRQTTFLPPQSPHILLKTNALLIFTYFFFFFWEKLHTKRFQWKGQFTVVLRTEVMIKVANPSLDHSVSRKKPKQPTHRIVSEMLVQSSSCNFQFQARMSGVLL